MKDKEHGQLASLTQTRDTLVKLRTALKNKLNNILSARGINLPKEALSSEKSPVRFPSSITSFFGVSPHIRRQNATRCYPTPEHG